MDQKLQNCQDEKIPFLGFFGMNQFYCGLICVIIYMTIKREVIFNSFWRNLTVPRF